MPRQARQPSSTGYYHVMIRGINKEHIFANNKCKEKYLELIKEQQEEERIKITAWCIMSNHVHFILHAELPDMSKAIKIISLKYAAYYNKFYDRIGPLFGDRYKSEKIETNEYLLCALRYIHNNPLEACLVNNFNEYKWSSYCEFFSENVLVNLSEKNFVTQYFNGSKERYINFHQQEDNRVYLDTKEDQEKRQFNKCLQLRQEYIKKYHITNASQLHTNKFIMSELSYKLSKQYGISIRKIAKLLETNYSIVHRAIQSYEQ